MTKLTIEKAVRGRELSTDKELRATRVNGKTELLPADPLAVAKILKERRNKSPAARLRAKLAADLAKRTSAKRVVQ
ncbi:MAG: hypothetical protein E5Y88_22355 [Mesorhizobium sp.]|uniref:hypothetical protein n=1 Tax=Mesorhizobium sp. TaxID=1871066 RepID=UPI0012083CD4|nr:hypothetical protein [Mesorhizobium sp.]TIL23670.1 MAG: hypothetical protein E5Y88_22355 [Mesorhizobium sp.]